MLTHDEIERFKSRIDIVDPAECWLWSAGKFADGYGALNYGSHKPGYAHRFSYLLRHGEIPEGAVVMHTCDTPACVNPNHLQAGSQASNIKDAVSRGRWMTPARKAWLGSEGNRRVLARANRAKSLEATKT